MRTRIACGRRTAETSLRGGNHPETRWHWPLPVIPSSTKPQLGYFAKKLLRDVIIDIGHA